MLSVLILILPWLAFFGFLALRVRMPRELCQGTPERSVPVSIVVPARNEALNIGTCLGSLTASRYPNFEVVVVDDVSDDGTADIARKIPSGNARRLRVVDGEPLPEGWLGKPWACAQGARVADGDLLLFTDADTVHGPELLAGAVRALEEDGADVVTVAGRQLMDTFWERLVQPQVFLTMILRFFDLDRALKRGRWRDAIANGQFFMFRREAYDVVGGHHAVRGEVVEDLALAQQVVRSGLELSVRMAEGALATRMYRSLRHLVEGWSKNLVVGARMTVPPRLRPWIAPASALSVLVLWIVPPMVLVLSLGGMMSDAALWWSVLTVAMSAAFWAVFTYRMGGPAWYGLLYPLGACMWLFILCRAWLRGRRVEWKGRVYVLNEPDGGI